MNLNPRQLRLLERETAWARHAWAKAQVESGGPTPALMKYLQESREECSQFGRKTAGEPRRAKTSDHQQQSGAALR